MRFDSSNAKMCMDLLLVLIDILIFFPSYVNSSTRVVYAGWALPSLSHRYDRQRKRKYLDKNRKATTTEVNHQSRDFFHLNFNSLAIVRLFVHTLSIPIDIGARKSTCQVNAERKAFRAEARFRIWIAHNTKSYRKTCFVSEARTNLLFCIQRA